MRPMEQVEVLRAACCVAGADGNVSDQERDLILALAEGCGVGDASLQAMIERAQSDCSFCDEQFLILKSDPQDTMAILLELAMADGGIGDGEKDMLRSFAGRLNVPDDVFAALFDKIEAMIAAKHKS